MIGLLTALVLIALLVLGIRAALARTGGGGPADGAGVRRFFQYLLLLGLLMVAAGGLSGLLGRLLDRSPLVELGPADLALSVTFTVIGVPLYAVVALWSRRHLRSDPGEAASVGWAVYAAAVSLIALVVAMLALYEQLAWATGLEDYDGRSLARLVVWGAVWAVHWWLEQRTTPQRHSPVHHLLGSLIGLSSSAAGLAGLLAGTAQVLPGLHGRPSSPPARIPC